MYQLSQKAITALNDARPESIRALTVTLDCSENTINRHIRENVPNGDLTKKASLEEIQKVTGLKENQILECAFDNVEQ